MSHATCSHASARTGQAVSRRLALASIGALAVGCATGAGAVAAQSSAAPGALKALRGCVDVHHHFYPDFLMREWASAPAGDAEWAAYKATFMREPFMSWTPRKAVDLLDANGVATAVLSIPAGTFDFLARKDLASRIRRCNEFATRMQQDFPGRFGLFTILPMPDIAATLDEIAYADDQLKATGFALMTSYGDKWLGHSDFVPVLEELNRRKAVVHVHPKAPACCIDKLQSNPGLATTLLEFPYDTGRTIFELFQSKALVRFRDIKWVFSHCGGVIPMLAGRLKKTGGKRWKDLEEITPNGFDYEFQRLFYDTASSAYKPTMSAFLSYIPVSQGLFGTDYPHMPVDGTIADFAALELPPATVAAIQRDNPRRVLQRLAPFRG